VLPSVPAAILRPVASANLDLVKSICAAWEAGEYGATDWADPNLEFVIADGISPGSWQGLAGMAQGWREWLSAWEDFRQQVAEYRELDDQRILVVFRASGRGKTSGLDLELIGGKVAGLFELRGGKVVRFVCYNDGEKALGDLA
jgi:hypothetical protein